MYSKDEKKKLVKDFWELFGKRCSVHPALKHKKKKWILHRTKVAGVALRFDVGRDKATVMIELHSRNEKLRLKAFEILEKYKPVLEDGFENGLIWDFYYERPDSGQAVCRIYTELENVDLHRQNQWPDIYNFFIVNMIKLENNFMLIRDVLDAGLKAR